METGKRINKAIISILVIIIICSIIGGTVYVFGVMQPQKKRGLIIVPSILGSALYDTSDGSYVWDPFPSVDVWLGNFMKHDPTLYIGFVMEFLEDPSVGIELNHFLANNGVGDGQSFICKVADIDEDGNPQRKLAPVSYEDDTRYKYGMLNSLSDIANYYEKNYGDYYEVSIFHYDWRLDNRYSAELLEEYVNQKGYDEVIFVSHSTGGNVVASYLSRSEENRDKVCLNISYSTPYLGSMGVLTYLETQDTFQEIIASVANPKALSKFKDVLRVAYNSQAASLFNMYSLYQMLPTWELLTGDEYVTTYKETIHNGTVNKVKETDEWELFGFIFDREDNGKVFRSEKALYRFYCSRPWALKSDGTLRQPMKDWLDYCHSMYVTNENGERVHVTELVNTVYVAGIDFSTPSVLHYSSTDKSISGGYIYEDFEDDDLGDGISSLGSSAANTDNYERIYMARSYRHFEIVTNFYYQGAGISEQIFARYLPDEEKNYIKLKSKLLKKNG